MKDIGKILPVDAYKTYLQDSLPTDYLSSLVHLYQPLLGLEATYLYQFLLQESKLYPGRTLQTHHTLMTYLNRPLDVVYQARLNLEALGLLKTFQHQREDKEVYTYILLAPFSPIEFLGDAMLSELLYRQIGETKFNSVRQLYTQEEPVQLGADITASFGDVFQTVQPQEPEESPINREEDQRGVQVEKMDFTYLQQVLLNKMIPAKKVLTETNKRIISQLKKLYKLDQYEIENALLWALTDENTLNTEQFKTACNDVFQSKYNHAGPQLSLKQQPPEQNHSGKKLSKTEKLTKHLETISPRELLEDLSAGKNAPVQDMKMISDIMTKQGLNMPVMNVAIYYCLLQSNMKLSRAYLEKIASHWSRLGIQTAAQAMANAMQEIQPATNKKQRRTPMQKKQSQEIIPDWFDGSKRTSTPSNEQANKPTNLNQKEHDEMLAILKRHSSNTD